MTIGFGEIPPGNESLIPFVRVEFDSSNASSGPSAQPHRVLLVGQKLAAGSAAVNTLVPITGTLAAVAAFGAGSMLAQMAESLFLNDASTDVTALAITEPGGAAATGTLTVTGTSTKAGAIAVYVAGQRVVASIPNGSAPTAVGAALVAAINGDPNLPCTAAAVAGVVTLTAKQKGPCGNDLVLQVAVASTDVIPPGLSVAVVGFAGGDTPTDITTALATIGEEWFTVWAVGVSDPTAITDTRDKLEELFDANIARGGVAMFSLKGTHGQAIDAVDNVNSQHISIMPAEGSSTPPWRWAAAMAGQVVKSTKQDPARPFKTLPLRGIQAPAAGVQWTELERNLLLKKGGATFLAGNDGVVRIERMVTTYLTNAAGAADPAFRDLRTVLTLTYLRYDTVLQTQLRYPRHKLRADGDNLPIGQPIVTPSLYRGFLLGLYASWEQRGLVEGREEFEATLVVEIDPSNPDRLNTKMSPNAINALLQVAVKMEFAL